MKSPCKILFYACAIVPLMLVNVFAEPLTSKKREPGKGQTNNIPQMLFFDAAEEDAQDKYAVIIDPTEEQKAEQENTEQPADEKEAKN